MIKMELQGINETTKAILRQNKRFAKNFKKGFEKAGRYILGKSRRIVPVDTKFLWKSGYVESQGDGLKTSVYVGYSAFYAIWVHERTEIVRSGIRQAKFLSKVIEAPGEQRAVNKIISEEAMK